MNFISFRLYVENRANSLVLLLPRDIYNFYYIFASSSYGKIHDEDKDKAEFFMDELRRKYISVFRPVLITQLKKYAQRSRIDPDFDRSLITPDADPRTLHNLMQKTFRSDMERRNVNWEVLSDSCLALSETSNFKHTCTHIDRINNAVHNSGKLMFDKLPNAPELMTAYDIVHRSRTPRDYARFTSPQVMRLARWLSSDF